MKKARRFLARGVVILVVLAGAGLLLSLDRVDDQPYFREPYFTETSARLQARLETNTVVRGRLSVGLGRARLTPDLTSGQEDPAGGRFKALPLAGYGNRRGQSATGVHDDLFVKAVALSVEDRLGIIVGADALIIPPDVTDAVSRYLQQELGLRREQVYLSATHTHCSLGAWGEGPVAEAFAGDFHPGVPGWFADRIVTAVRQALDDLQPASLGRGRFDAPDLVRNRLVGDLGKVDAEFSFIVIEQRDGVQAVLGSFAAHATVLSGDVTEFSGDYPGSWQRTVEETTGGSAVFLAGGMGSHSPVPPAIGFDGAEHMGRSLANRLLEQLPHVALTNSITFGTLGLEVTLPPLNVRVTDSIRLRPWISQRLLRSRERTFVQAFRLDDSVWISTPCDFSGELALNIKDFLRARGRDAVVTSFNGDYVGYVIPARYYHLQGYESRLMSFFGPNVPDFLDEMIRAMALSLAQPGGA